MFHFHIDFYMSVNIRLNVS